MLMQRTPQQIAEEDAILAQAKSIDAARRAEEAAARGPSAPGGTLHLQVSTQDWPPIISFKEDEVTMELDSFLSDVQAEG